MEDNHNRSDPSWIDGQCALSGLQPIAQNHVNQNTGCRPEVPCVNADIFGMETTE